MAYTGLAVTIPANCFFTFACNAWFINSSPRAVLLSDSSTSTTAYHILARNDDGASVTYSGTTGNSSETFYFWAMYNSVNNNTVAAKGWYGEF